MSAPAPSAVISRDSQAAVDGLAHLWIGYEYTDLDKPPPAGSRSYCGRTRRGSGGGGVKSFDAGPRACVVCLDLDLYRNGER